MGGKAAILLVLGFSMIFLVTGSNFNRLATTSVDNESEYYEETVVHNIATSAANIIAREIFFDPTWNGTIDKDFAGGKMYAYVETVDIINNFKRITAKGTYEDKEKIIRILLRPGRFSLFAYYSAYEPSGIWWTTGDEVTGPLHVQGDLQVSGSPIFRGMVTTKTGLVLKDPGKWVTKKVWNGKKYVNQQVWVPGTDNPQFLGGYNSGIDLPMPSDAIPKIVTEAENNGRTFPGEDTVFIKFEADSIKYKFKKANTYISEPSNTFSNNGLILAKDAVLRVEGSVKGKFTIISSGTGSYGKIFLDNDIVYNTDPQLNPASKDILGIVAQNDIMITDNIPNRSNINIHGSIYSQNGGFGAENYDSGSNRGHINLYGGIIQSTRRAVGTISGGSIATGYSKNYVYDQRLRLISPPEYPTTGSFQMVSWLE